MGDNGPERDPLDIAECNITHTRALCYKTCRPTGLVAASTCTAVALNYQGTYLVHTFKVPDNGKSDFLNKILY